MPEKYSSPKDPVHTSALPAWVGAGDVLVGSLALDDGKKEVTKLPLTYEAPPQPIKVRRVTDHATMMGF